MVSRPLPAKEVSRDFLYRRRVILCQHRQGYRFAVDAPILAAFLPRCAGPVLEVGCGNGVVSLLALFRRKFPAVTALELQPGLVRLARRNARENGFQEIMKVVRGDFRASVRYRAFSGQSLVFSNPPFLQVNRGRLSASEEVRIAKFEVALTLPELVARAAAILAPDGRLCLIIPFSRYPELEPVAAAAGLWPSRLRTVQPFVDAPPDRLLVEWRKGRSRRSAKKISPLVIFNQPGEYTDAMNVILIGPSSERTFEICRNACFFTGS